MNTSWLDVDLHRLELRFSGARLVEPGSVEQLARSIERGGQIVPCIAVADPPVKTWEGNERLVLIDGYRRVAALRRLGRDTARVEFWPCDLAEALLGMLARAHMRPFAAFEEALLVRELMQGLGLSQHELARRCGRDVSWVSRRLQLLSALPNAALVEIREGRLSHWAASRVVAPLARANTAHADRLLQALSRAPLSTRDLGCWFTHYQEASRVTRERLVSHPQLFIQAQKESTEQRTSARLRDGPEGECEADLRHLNQIIGRLRKQLATLRPFPEAVANAVLRLQTSFEALCNDIKRNSEHDPDGNTQQCAGSQVARSDPARDQPPAQAVA
jgi:ParB family transcriptional regulator, chromosome partitioning protein